MLKKELDSCDEFLPVSVDGRSRYILNVTNVLNLMVKEKSIYKIYSDGEVGMCEHAFLKEPDAGELIYQVPSYLGRIFVNSYLNDFINEKGLTGALIRQYRNP